MADNWPPLSTPADTTTTKELLVEGWQALSDQPRALREMVRVTKPAGRVLVIAYGHPSELGFLQFFVAAMKAVAPEFPGLPDEPPALEFQVADREVLRQRLTDAGLRDVRVQRTGERPVFTSEQEMWDWLYYGNPIAEMVVGDRTKEQRQTLVQVLGGMRRERAQGNGKAGEQAWPTNCIEPDAHDQSSDHCDRVMFRIPPLDRPRPTCSASHAGFRRRG
jgi:SAM-dependent methyltransferase